MEEEIDGFILPTQMDELQQGWWWLGEWWRPAYKEKAQDEWRII
jgi:hypothetical protein